MAEVRLGMLLEWLAGLLSVTELGIGPGPGRFLRFSFSRSVVRELVRLLLWAKTPDWGEMEVRVLEKRLALRGPGCWESALERRATLAHAK